MTMTTPLPSLDTLKTQAKRLRSELAKSGTTIGHSAALELLAKQQGFKDWNTLHAAAGHRQTPAPVTLGQQVSGRYLDQPFTGEVLGVQKLTASDMFRVTLHFDQPVEENASHLLVDIGLPIHVSLSGSVLWLLLSQPLCDLLRVDRALL